MGSTKSEWRGVFRQRLSNLGLENELQSNARRERVSLALHDILAARPGLWLAFSKTKDEPDVDRPVQGVRFAYPRVAEDRSMTFYERKDAAATAKAWDVNRFGIREPAVGDSSWREVTTQELRGGDVRGVLVPGLGFDRRLRRLGRGAGFYDRFLENTYLKVGVGFAEQLVEELPVESHDVSLDGLVTDQDVIWKVSAESGRTEGSQK